MPELINTIYNFKIVFSEIKSTWVKLIPTLLLICSIMFVDAQNNPSSAQKKKVKEKPKKSISKNKNSLKSVDSTNTNMLMDSMDIDSLLTFDTMDTVHLQKSKSALKTKVKYTARDSIVYSADKKVVYLYGDAKVFYEDLNIKADFIKIELDKNLITTMGTIDSSGKLIGSPVFKQGTQEFKALRIAYNYKTKRGYLSEFGTTEGEGYVHGKDVIKNEDNEFGIQHARYTTCSADSPHFYITAYKLKVIPDKKVVALWPNLVIEDINTPLIFPFAIFPIKKGQSSGLIIPQYGSDISRGFFLRAGGYYIGLGDHADLQVTGDIYSNLSWGSHTIFRYANRYHYNGNLVFNYANNQFGLPEDPSYRTQKDFQLTWLHSQDSKARPGTNFSANVNLVSSTYLSTNSYNAQNIVTNQMVSSISYGKSMKGGKYNLSTNARVSQNTLTRDIGISFPDFTFNVSSFTPLKSKFKPVADKWYENISTNYTFQFRNQFDSKDSLLFRSRTASEFNDYYDTTGRFGMLHTLPIQTSFKIRKYYTLSARVGLNEYWYYKTIRKEIDAEGNLVTKTYDGFERAFTYNPSVSLNTRYYGMKQFSKGKISAIRHVLIPTVGLSYTPDYSNQSYYKTYTDATGKIVKYSIFERGLYGTPGSTKQGNIDFALDNNLEMKVWKGKDTARKEQKVQLFETIKAAGAYNIFADSLNLSNISLSARTKLFKNVTINGSAALDPYKNVIDETNGYKSVRRINQFYLKDGGGLGSINTAQIGLNATFNQNLLKGKKTTDKKGYSGELKYINDFPGEYADFNVPWTLTVNYTVGYNKYTNLNTPAISNFIQTLNYSGDFNLTKKWKIGYSSGYDFKNKAVSFTSINMTRDLHCWEFKFDWIPFGPRQSFLFTIHVKASILQELKQTRRREWFDRTI